MASPSRSIMFSPFGGLLAAAALLSTFAVAGCPGSLENPERFTGGGGSSGTCPDIEVLFEQRCADTTCHNADDAAGGLDLVTSGVGDRIVDQAGTSPGCQGTPMADPNDPTGSVLYDVLLETSCSPFGQMPFGDDPLTQQEIDCVEAYIAGLTPGNPTTSSSTGGGMGGMGMGGAGMGGMGMGGAGGM